MHLRVAKCCDENVANLSERDAVVVATSSGYNSKTSEPILSLFFIILKPTVCSLQ